ncbi:chemerin-like receptor 1 [Hoplias malabaricus]|uniref:chemerin-like receptor 1 n=1 Tax=Hoplias malabaricus TaxID=27720 RepID=UPI003462131C
MNSTQEREPDYPDYDYTYTNIADPVTPPLPDRDSSYIYLAIINIVVFILGVAGNGLVIWIAGFKLRKSVNTTLYLSLAVSDFLFCSFLPFGVVKLVKDDWIFGLHMCKFTSFVMFLNMFSSIFLLVIISVDRCVVVMFPVWAQNKRSVKKASVIVVLAWIISAVCGSPSVFIREVTFLQEKNVCYNNYPEGSQSVIVSFRFIVGFLVPFLIIISCYLFIILKLKINQSANSKKPFKIMTALIVTFFICWLPFHIFALMELNNYKNKSILQTGQVLGAIFATANSCMNPFLYAFMGKDFKRKCSAIISKIENAIEDEGRSTIRATSITTSGEKRHSTAV